MKVAWGGRRNTRDRGGITRGVGQAGKKGQERMGQTPPRGALLDLDGTLIDSNDAHAHAWVTALASSGFDIPFARVRRLIGMGGDKLLPEVADVTKDSPQGERLSKDWERIFVRDYQPHLRPFPQVRALLTRLREAGLRVAIASSSQGAQLDALLRIADIADLLDGVTSSDDAAQSKPDPDIVGAALRKLGLAPTEAVLIGDTPYDIAAAQPLGVRTIAVRCGGWGDADLAGAIAIYDDPADLLARFGTSSLARG
jgi:HAD superfamily hydrolase (TIGR01509 family)